MNSPTSLPPLANQAPSNSTPRLWFLRYPVATFLACLALAFVLAPFEERVRNGDLLESAMLTLVLLPGFLAIRQRHRTIAWGIVLVTPALVGKWFDHWAPGHLPAAAFIIPALLFIAFVIAHLMRFILRARRIDSEVLSAALANYLMLGLLWAFGYILVGTLSPDAFAFGTGPDSSHSMKGFTALYFSFITLTTVGYGDIAPVSGAARMLAMVEAMTGTIYVAVLISRLVSLYSSSPTSPEPNPRNEQGIT
jgi:hypothetical protein